MIQYRENGRLGRSEMKKRPNGPRNLKAGGFTNGLWRLEERERKLKMTQQRKMYRKVLGKPITPILDELMADGIVRKEGFEYVGMASDGVEVGIGCVLEDGDLMNLEEWLEKFPTPDLW